MKKLLATLGLILALTFSANAQLINININLDRQPSWGPAGYDYAEFYYFPDINIYYDVPNTLFYYLSGSKWESNRYLPNNYRKYNLHDLYKVVVNEKQPWRQNKTHKKTYSHYKGDRTQESIRYSNDSRYNKSKNNRVNWVNTDNQPNRNNSKGNNNTQVHNDRNKQNNHSNNNSRQQNSSNNNRNSTRRN